MKVQTKLFFLLSLILSVFIIAFAVQIGFEYKRLKFLLNERQNEETEIFDKVLNLKGKSLETLAFDYTYWDEMVNFIVSGDKAWAKRTIDESVLSNYRTDAIWIYRTDLALAYSINSLNDPNLKDIPLPKETFNRLFLKECFSHFFINTPSGLMEVRGATIHPTNDVQRNTAPYGYFFAGRLWDKNYIEELQAATGSKITVTPVTQQDARNNINLKVGIISFSRVLTGWDKSPLMHLNASIKSEGISYFVRTTSQQLFLLFVFALIVLSFIIFTVTRWIGLPLQLISRTLNTENTTYLNKLQKERDEFGDMARLISDFFKQKEELTEEISERKRQEDALKVAYGKLKQTQADLIQASKMSGVGSLASGVAHEINNPLTGVLNNVQLIKMAIVQNKAINPDDFRELLDSMEESAQRCVNITRTLLDFSRPSKGTFQPVSIKEMIGKVLILIKHELDLGNIKIQRDIEPDLPEIKGDSQLLQQTIIDLIANAKWAIEKKSKREGGIITIHTRYEPDRNSVNINISDTGIGIPQENLKRVFEPFFTTKGVGEGSGLGLFMVYNIIKEHRGNIEVESKINEGTTFKISLPVG